MLRLCAWPRTQSKYVCLHHPHKSKSGVPCTTLDNPIMRCELRYLSEPFFFLDNLALGASTLNTAEDGINLSDNSALIWLLMPAGWFTMINVTWGHIWIEPVSGSCPDWTAETLCPEVHCTPIWFLSRRLRFSQQSKQAFFFLEKGSVPHSGPSKTCFWLHWRLEN